MCRHRHPVDKTDHALAEKTKKMPADLDSERILPGERSVGQLVPVHNPGVPEDLQDSAAKIKVLLNLC